MKFNTIYMEEAASGEESANSGTSTTTETETTATTTDETTKTETTTSYLDGKYKSVSELETGYKELQSSYSKKLAGFDGAPEAYTKAEGIAEGDPLYAYASTWGKDNQLNDKALNEFVEGYNTKQAEDLKAYQTEQIKLLGDDAKYRLENVNDYLKANTEIDEVALQQINDGLFGAKGIEVLEKLISLNKAPAPTERPPVATPDAEALKAMRFAKDEYGNRKMNDPAYRAKVMKLEEDARG